jgi:methyltransferase (TIGR00027 family)
VRGLRVVFLIAAALPLSAAIAVVPGAVSSTAVYVCEYRAIGARNPDPKLRNPDRLAGKLCPSTGMPQDFALARQVMDRDPERYSGYFFVNARTLHIDAQLVAAAKAGIRQVVVLGAGYDSRAYRFHKAYPKTVFFEVDLPPMIAAKQGAVASVFGSLPRQVRYVPIDFNTQTLESVLAAAGYDRAKKSLFILEGVMMYVNDAGNDATFAFVGSHSAPGSRVVYDYVLRRAVEGDFNGLYAAETTVKGVAALGEPFVTGWTPAEAAAFAAKHGLTVVEDLDDTELTRRYLLDSRGRPDGRLPDWQRIIDAVVR